MGKPGKKVQGIIKTNGQDNMKQQIIFSGKLTTEVSRLPYSALFTEGGEDPLSCFVTITL